MSYMLIDLPKFDPQSILPQFERLVLNKALLQTPMIGKAKESYRLYAVIDGALNQEVDQSLETYQPEYRRLYPEHYSKAAGYAQPYLVQMQSAKEFTAWFMEYGYGNAQALYIFSPLDIDTLRSNISTFAIGRMEEGDKETFFRFYDPRIFPAFLRILSANQLEVLYDSQSYWLCENYIAPEELHIYRYDTSMQALFRAEHDLSTISTPLLQVGWYWKVHESIKEKEFFQGKQESMRFSKQDIAVISQNRLNLHAKQVAYSLAQQYTPYKEKSIKALYKEVLGLTHKGYALGMHQPDANYLWVVANIWHSGIEKLRDHERYGKIFDTTGDVTQGQKSLLLETLIEELEEKLETTKDRKDA